jgi:hypothetical protein
MTQTNVPTPPQDHPPAKGYGNWVPHDLRYDAEFEDSLVDIVLNADADPREGNGIRVIAEDSDETPIEGTSVRDQDVDRNTLPEFTETDLPIPMTDSRRIYASHIPGVKLTHPYGWFEGGPPLDPEMDTFPEHFLNQHANVTTYEQLQKAVQKEVDSNLELLKSRLRARQAAKERNDQIAKEIKMLTDQHDMELRLQQRMQEEQRKKKEARRTKQGGG